MEGHPDTPCLQAAADAARSFHGVRGFVPPSWEALLHGVKLEPPQPDEFEPGCQRGGWQHEVASRVEVQFRDENLFNRLENAWKALVRSQGGVRVHWHSPLARCAASPAWIRTFSKSSSCVVFVFPSPFLCAVAGVAFHSFPVATTAQRVHGLGSWGGGSSLWRVRQPRSAARLAAGSPPMSWSVIWIWLRPTCSMRDVWRRPSSLRWCPVGCGHHHDQCPPRQRRRERTCPEVVGHALGWLCWALKWEADGRLRLALS